MQELVPKTFFGRVMVEEYGIPLQSNQLTRKCSEEAS